MKQAELAQKQRSEPWTAGTRLFLIWISYRSSLLTPVQFFAHDLHDSWQSFICCLYVQEAQAGPAGDDIDGCAGILFDGILNLRKKTAEEESRSRTSFSGCGTSPQPQCRGTLTPASCPQSAIFVPSPEPSWPHRRPWPRTWRTGAGPPRNKTRTGSLNTAGGCWGRMSSELMTAGPDLFLQTVVLDQADVEGGGPALGPVQHQTYSLTRSCWKSQRFHGCIQGLLRHGPVGGPLPASHTQTHTPPINDRRHTHTPAVLEEPHQRW